MAGVDRTQRADAAADIVTRLRSLMGDDSDYDNMEDTSTSEDEYPLANGNTNH